MAPSHRYNRNVPGGTTSSLLSQIAYQPFGPAVWTQGSGALYSRTFDQDGRIVGLALSYRHFRKRHYGACL